MRGGVRAGGLGWRGGPCTTTVARRSGPWCERVSRSTRPGTEGPPDASIFDRYDIIDHQSPEPEARDA